MNKRVVELAASGMLAVASGIWLWWQSLLPAQSVPTHGFSAYYTASRVLIENPGEFGLVYDNAWFQDQIRVHDAGLADIFNVQPPARAFLALPVAWLHPGSARFVWCVLSFLGFSGALLWVVRRLGASWAASGVLLALAWQYEPLAADLTHGQAYSLLTVAAVVTSAAPGAFSNRWLAGVVAGFAAATKTALLPASGLTALWGGRRYLFAFACGGLAVLLSSIALVGLSPWLRYLGQLPAFVRSPSLASRDYQTIHSLCLRLLAFDEVWSRSPMADSPVVAAVLSAGLRLIVVVWSVHIYRRASSEIRIVTALAPVVLVMPVGEDHHYVLLAPALAAAWVVSIRARWPFRRLLLVAATGMLALPMEELRPVESTGLGNVLQYPRVAGSLMLLAWAHLSTMAGKAPTTAT